MADRRAVRCEVPLSARALVDLDGCDYRDAFAVEVPGAGELLAEAWSRVLLTPRGRRGEFGAALWQSVTGTRTPRAGKRLAAFQVVAPGPAAALLVGEGPRYRIRLVVSVEGACLTLATFVQSRSPRWRRLLPAIMFCHRRVAPRLLEAAAKRRGSTIVRRLVRDGQPDP